jgi:NADPH:quinone reductase-like Zn-dependent oxidoreductase
VTHQPGKPYASPDALRAAVTARAKAAVRADPRFTVAELLRQFAYARLLARVFTHEPESWVLKGGIGLLARLPSTRHSMDVDLWSSQQSLAEAERALERCSAVDLGDHATFEVGAWRERLDREAARPLAQATVTCRIGRRQFVAFGVDLVSGPFPPLEPEPVPPLRPIDVPGLLDAPLRVYPVAATVADKLSGILARHGERLSTRYRDLVDLATIALTEPLVAGDVYLAIHEELRRQDLAVPAEFDVPAAEAWMTGYGTYTRALPLLRGVGFEEALALVKALLDPVMAGRREGTWRPETRSWEPDANRGGTSKGWGQPVEGRAAEGEPGLGRPQSCPNRLVPRSQPMRALVADPSASPALSLADVPEPSPGPGQLLVRMEAASINRGEIRSAGKQPPGTVIGWDIAGSVVALGEGVTGFEVGQRVLSLSTTGGAFAELAAVPAAWTTPLPSATDPVLAATLPVAGVTAVNILRLARAHAGDRVLVTGAAGGVGLLTVQLALDAKATVTGQASSEQRAAAVRDLGADALIHPGDGSPVDGEFDVVLDGIGGPMFAPLLRATAQGGRMVVYGNSADAESTFRVEDFYPKAITIFGFRVFQSVSPEQATRDLAMLAEQLTEGHIRVAVQATAPLSDALPLVRDLYDRKVTGKVVITG